MPQKTDPVTTVDTATIQSAQRNPADFEMVYRAFVQSVFKYLWSHTSNRNDAEELTAQTFLAAFERLPGYRDNGYFSAWLFTIARNKAADFHRRRGRFEETDLQESLPAELDVAEETADTDRLEALSKMIRTLAAHEQELLRLRFVADLSFAEIAALQGRKLDTVKKKLYRLLARLQAQMETGNE